MYILSSLPRLDSLGYYLFYISCFNVYMSATSFYEQSDNRKPGLIPILNQIPY